uniref:CCR4-NOT transcription complex subunit 4 n=1 Tax=Cairina moschata TaxID=8855 RepID=A0A8C3BC17_CAIMO
MSRSPDAKEDPVECPLCMEPLEIDDINFFPCTCGYQICRFCWHRIRTDENGLCPACRKPYPEDPAVYKPLSQEELQRIKNEKKQKQNERKQKISENRKHLASVRVVQKNLVFVVGLSQRLADPEVLKRPEYFGKFGKIHKVVINNSTSYAGSQGPSASAYVTYIRSEDALRAIQCVNNVVVDGRTLKASLGTTKYCSYFLKNMQCPKPDCMYLHELGDEAASFTKEEMQAGKHQEYEQKLLQELYKLNPNFLQLSTGTVDKNKNKVTALQRPNSNNKDAWPSLQSSSKSANGLTMEHRKTPPILENGTDPEHMTPDGADSDFGPIDKPSDSLSIGNGDSSQQITNSDTPSPPPGLTKPNPVIPISSSNHSARSPFEGAVTESQSLFSDNFRHPNPIPSGLPPFPSSPQTSNDWPTAPEPQSLFTSETIPVSSSTDWQAAFGFASELKKNMGKYALGEDFLFFYLSFFLLVNLPDNSSSVESLNMKEWQDGLRALLPNININFGGLPNASSPSNANHSVPTSNTATTDSLNWDSPGSWMDPAIITGIPASTGNSLDTLQDDNPPHWLKSLQALTEVDGPSAAPSQTHHSNPFGTQIPLHRASWNPYSPPSNPTSFHSPPPGFQTAFRPPSKTPTDLLQSSALDRH